MSLSKSIQQLSYMSDTFVKTGDKIMLKQTQPLPQKSGRWRPVGETTEDISKGEPGPQWNRLK